MRIATWNIERLKHHKDSDRILEACMQTGADILVLTETDERIRPDYPYSYRTPLLSGIRPDYYADTENRVSIYSKYPCVASYDTYDKHTAICVELETERGQIVVYGTIIGIFGNREASFKEDLLNQMRDIERLTSSGKNVCVIGDYNCTFCDSYYYTKIGRDQITETFDRCGITLVTGDRPECIDHIALSGKYLTRMPLIAEWNYDKSLSDHKGIVVDI